ncbi:hypothetical protein VPEG_00095 [Vibrio phage SIO-2]|uniref:hypothetical protein n=1 Tax=Vibrio phage SIO-2 TaxID=700512 RepID=UPI0002357C84|nr:hypothetical protein VPEG_00095 [Vibrio phage SIO-2]AET42245.1 hypothetical protein VPEG_00095 [Vibrio phage SIO-2]
MQTSQSVTFVKSVESSGSADLLKLMLVDEDNISPLEEWREAYYALNGEYPTTVRKSEVEEYSQVLNETLTHSFSRTLRLYGADLVNYYDLSKVRANSLVKGSTRTATATESVSLNGVTQLNLNYPVRNVTSFTSELVTADGAAYDGSYEISPSGALVFKDAVYGFAECIYDHVWLELTITGSSTTAKDKKPSYVIVKSDQGVDSLEVVYPDVEDPESGITPDDETFIRIWAHRGKNNRAIRDPLDVTDYIEQSRTISPIDVNGVQIERAATVTFKVGETDETIRLIFDLPLNQEPQSGG